MSKALDIAGLSERVMHRLWTRSAVAIVACVVLSVLACAAYDFACFQPALARMRADMPKQPAEDRDPPEFAVDLLEFSANGDTVPYAARLLLLRFDKALVLSSGMAWQLRYTAWCRLVAMHMSERDRLGLIASYAPTGPRRHGLLETAEDLYSRPPSALTQQEIAAVVMLIRVPSVGQGPLDIDALGERFLASYQAAIRAGVWKPPSSRENE